MSWPRRHWKLLALVVGLVVGISSVGHAIAYATSDHWCGFRGWPAWHSIERQHPSWSRTRDWVAVSTCRGF